MYLVQWNSDYALLLRMIGQCVVCRWYYAESCRDPRAGLRLNIALLIEITKYKFVNEEMAFKDIVRCTKITDLRSTGRPKIGAIY
jgi:hypothetical protein